MPHTVYVFDDLARRQLDAHGLLQAVVFLVLEAVVLLAFLLVAFLAAGLLLERLQQE